MFTNAASAERKIIVGFIRVESEVKVFTCNYFNGHWPVGVAAVVVAASAQDAKSKLEDELFLSGLGVQKIEIENIKLLKTDKAKAIILADGNY